MGPLVSPSWLADRLSDPGTLILDATLPPVGRTPPVDTRSRYRAQHIPGALFFDIDACSDHATPLPHMLPAAEDFSRSMSALGASDGMALVIYEQESVFSAPRAWWMFRTFGVQDVYVLDGGLKAWLESGLPTQEGEAQRAPSVFTAGQPGAAVRSFQDVQGSIARGEQILDARAPGRFTGAAPEPRPGIRSGHMPGAINLPYTDLLEAGRLKQPSALIELFQARGIDLEEPITTTCGSGVTAAVLALGLELAGASAVGLYDGSWAEYAQRPEAQIEPGAPEAV